MAKAGMRRYTTGNPQGTEGTENAKKTKQPKNDVEPVPEIQGKAKKTKEKANPIDYNRKSK